MKNLKEKIQNNKGITLVALVVTIIVLLILAGVSLSAVFSQQGIFNRAENAVDKHSQSKARETLDLVFSEAQMKKYDEGLSEDELNKMIEGVGQLLPKDDPESKYQLVIVDGYIFEIDRSVPKVVEYKGPADGIIITATVSGNNGWIKPGEAVTVKGSIKIYGEGSIATSSATSTNSSVSLAGFPSKGGDFTINNITEDTDIKITATDSTGKTYEKTVKVVVKRDTTPPTITEVKAEAERMTIKISATGHDKNASGVEESGIKQFKYTITPIDGIPEDKVSGEILPNEKIEIITTPSGVDEREYTITVTAIDNVNNTTPKEDAKTATVKTENYLTIAEAKEKINASTYPDYIGTKVIDYNPTAGGTWRVFYYDEEGYFGDGVGAIYIRRDEEISIELSGHDGYDPDDKSGFKMDQMNPMWKLGIGGDEINTANEYYTAYLCDSKIWNPLYKDEKAKYAIACPSIEMWLKARNAYVKKYESNVAQIRCGILNESGYGYGLLTGNLQEYNIFGEISRTMDCSIVISNGNWNLFASPSAHGEVAAIMGNLRLWPLGRLLSCQSYSLYLVLLI